MKKTHDQCEYFRLDQDVLKTASEDKDERSLQDVFKTSSFRQMFAGWCIKNLKLFGVTISFKNPTKLTLKKSYIRKLKLTNTKVLVRKQYSLYQKATVG